MLKRAWRFLALLSVTPLMTVVCVVALVWITRHVLHEERVTDEGWSVQKLAAALGYRKPIEYPRDWPAIGYPAGPRINFDVVVESDGQFELVKQDSLPPESRSIIVAYLYPPDNISSRGVFAVTQHGWIRQIRYSGDSTNMNESAVRLLTSSKVSDDLRPYWMPLLIGRDHFYTTTAMQGYAWNAAALVILILGLRSVVWLWRGVPLRELRGCFARHGQCTQCGYSLAGLNAEKCPECGTEPELKATS